MDGRFQGSLSAAAPTLVAKGRAFDHTSSNLSGLQRSAWLSLFLLSLTSPH